MRDRNVINTLIVRNHVILRTLIQSYQVFTPKSFALNAISWKLITAAVNTVNSCSRCPD